MTISTRAAVLVLGFGLVPVAALAQATPAAPSAPSAPREADNSRFTLRETPDGWLRMDGKTGQMTFCSRQNATVTCRLAADDRAELQAEIDRLKAENDTLRRGGATAQNRPGGSDQNLNLPSDQEVDRALSLAERIIRRFMAIVRESDGDQGRRL
ncbi:hypothetical protein [Phreatobacter sp. AB_2022a]|uniref:hypothetical protein n=1 Tax=Phreatobacter sp. AB_2022a TaxID=3003134 RepID=UPI002286EEA4|nr:hypothetical protein [Phreatobacter sp. AB_2022a]MCZ0734872.1 hypothetical protein [Phreatobacter sp. AB_2022a]